MTPPPPHPAKILKTYFLFKWLLLVYNLQMTTMKYPFSLSTLPLVPLTRRLPLPSFTAVRAPAGSCHINCPMPNIFVCRIIFRPGCAARQASNVDLIGFPLELMSFSSNSSAQSSTFWKFARSICSAVSTLSRSLWLLVYHSFLELTENAMNVFE